MHHRRLLAIIVTLPIVGCGSTATKTVLSTATGPSHGEIINQIAACETADRATIAWAKDFQHLPSANELPSATAEANLAHNDTDAVSEETALKEARTVLPPEGREAANSLLATTVRLRQGLNSLMGATTQAMLLPAMSQLLSATDELKPSIHAFESACASLSEHASR